VTWLELPLKRALRVASPGGVAIKGAASQEPAEGLYPAYSASGQDVWVSAEHATFNEAGLVLSAVGARCGKTFLAAGRWGVVANTAVLLPRPGHDPRFLWYATNREDFWERGGTAQPYVLVGYTLDRSVPLPPLHEQRRIADFLDYQVALLDRATELRQKQEALLVERGWADFAVAVAAHSRPQISVRRLLTFLTDGPFGSAFTSGDYVESGARAVRLGNIGFAEYRRDSEVFIPHELWAQFPRCHVRPGDILVAGLGDPTSHAGRACVAPDLGRALVKGKCFCGRVDDRIASVEYLALLLSSPIGADLVAAKTRGSTRRMINLDIFKSFSVPLPDRATQERIVEDAMSQRRAIAEAHRLSKRQAELLEERKQALITAAVTGRFDVTAARAVA
jgi:type I restriction enzyme S subunit